MTPSDAAMRQASETSFAPHSFTTDIARDAEPTRGKQRPVTIVRAFSRRRQLAVITPRDSSLVVPLQPNVAKRDIGKAILKRLQHSETRADGVGIPHLC